MSNGAFTSWGSANSIDSSCHVLELGGKRIGIDYGLGDVRSPYDGPLDVMMYSHAHLDHMGLAPLAHTRWPKAHHYMTYESRALANCCWEDVLYIARKNREPLPYTETDIARLNSRWRRLIAGRIIDLGGGVKVTPIAAGHILGAVGFDFQYRGEHYIVTGDVSVRGHGFIEGAQIPTYERTRLLVRESTYVGQRLVESRADTIAKFVRFIKEVLARGGRVLIPAFTIDRAPEVYAILLLADIDFSQYPLYVTGGKPQAEIYQELTRDGYILSTMRRFNNRKEQVLARESRQPMIVIASSGMMMEGTASYAWGREILNEPESAICIVGWQDPNTPGGRILNATRGGTVLLPTGEQQVLCEVYRVVLTGHSYEDDMKIYEDRVNPDEVIHVHGEDEAIGAFLASSDGRGRTRHKAEVGRSFQL